MLLHILQHVPFEGAAFINDWARQKNITINETHLYRKDPLPEINSFDCLVIMGGPMSVSDEVLYPWLKEEKIFIQEAISAQKKIIGICLGAQLIAAAMGAAVHKNQYKEIGFFPVERIIDNSLYNEFFPEKFIAFHWHGQTFEIPEGAVHIFKSEACNNQGFIYNDRIFALQFHLESTRESIEVMLQDCDDDLTDDKYVQTLKEIRDNYFNINNLNGIMAGVMEYLLNQK